MATRLVLLGTGEPGLAELADWLRNQGVDARIWEIGAADDLGDGVDPLIVDADGFGAELGPMLAAARARWPKRPILALTRRPVGTGPEAVTGRDDVAWLHRSRPLGEMGFAVTAVLGLRSLVDLDGEGSPRPSTLRE